MPYVLVRSSYEMAIRQFRRACVKDNLSQTFHALKAYKKPSEVRKLKREVGRKRAYQRMLRDNPILMKAYQATRKTTRVTTRRPKYG